MLLSLKGFSQTHSELRLFLGSAHLVLVEIKNVTSPEFENIETRMIGGNYLHPLGKDLYLVSGFRYQYGVVDITEIGDSYYQHKEETFQLMSIPLQVEKSFWKYFFVHGGPSIDWQMTKSRFDQQSGIGMGIGLGASYRLNNFSFFINPRFKMNALIPFREKPYKHNLTELGLQFGLGYKL
ncbi:hypothetical protein GCM10023331_34920 [Algivirga pacifica]|uniref:Outer membrane protein beta-barrel domain-containing protein n=2 Tax=Algivirga pacifica TaxID=1162670 RepID=A0ABP9DJH6_9BACT